MKHEYDPQRINDLAAELLSPQSFSGGGVARLKRALSKDLPSEEIAPAASQPGFKLYHGTPHEFGVNQRILDTQTGKEYVSDPKMAEAVMRMHPDRYRVLDENPLGMFDLNRAGTGEGAQAYGFGTYATEVPDVGRGYRQSLLRRHDIPDEIKIGDQLAQDLYASIEQSASRKPVAEARADYDKLEIIEQLMLDGDILGIRQQRDSYTPEAYAWFEQNIAPNVKRPGALYEMQVNAPKESLLDWDKSITDQTPEVQAILRDAGIYNPELEQRVALLENERQILSLDRDPVTNQMRDERRWHDISNEIDQIRRRQPANMTGSQAYYRAAPDATSQREASEALLSRGIPGLQYLDEMSRSSGDGTRNYVLFDPKMIEILEKYGLAGASTGAALLGAGEMIGTNQNAEPVQEFSGGGIARAASAARKGALDMSHDARMQRAQEQQYLPETYYHATSSDFNEFVPKYEDGLTFITPNVEFANNWLGKGGSRSKLMSARHNDPISLEYKTEKQKIWNKYASKYGDDIDLWPETEMQNYNNERNQVLDLFNSIDQSIYPLKTNVQNTFDPRQHEDVIIEYLRSQGRDPYATTIERGLTDLDYYKLGNYLLYENPEIVRLLKSKGFDSMRLAESTYDRTVDSVFDTLAVFDPSKIRSINAAFNPDKKGSADILAGTAGAAILGGAALKDEPEEFAEGGRAQSNPLSWLNQKFYENISKPAVGAAVDMTLGLGDLAQMAARYLGDRAGFDTGEFVSVADPVKRALGVDDYDPYTLGAAATNILPFARGRDLAGAGVNALQRTFPNIGRETAAYGGAELAAAGAREFAPDSPMAEMAAAFVGGMGGSALGSSPDALGIIKQKGGNWIEGESYVTPQSNIIDVLPYVEDIPELDQWMRNTLYNYIKKEMGTAEDPIRMQADQFAIEKPRLLAAKDEQIASAVANLERAAAERGVDPEVLTRSQARIRELQQERAIINERLGMHYNPDTDMLGQNVPQKRGEYGYPESGVGQSQIARNWELVSDDQIEATKRSAMSDDIYEIAVDENPWLDRVSPEANIYTTPYDYAGGALGFDHLIDELRNAVDPASDLPDRLRIDLEDLKKMKVPQAVRLVDEINAWRSAGRAQANPEAANNPAVATFKEYETIPGTQEPNAAGLRWVEIKPSNEQDLSDVRFERVDDGFVALDSSGQRLKGLSGYDVFGSENAARDQIGFIQRRKQVEDALKYEGANLNHCVGGYCEPVMQGRSRIYSLRDADGRPHVTIEEKDRPFVYSDIVASIGEDAASEMLDAGYTLNEMAERIPNLQRRKEIIQIKGKSNEAPVEEYLPFVQDFIRTQNFDRIGDFSNTGLVRLDPQSDLARAIAESGKPVPQYLTQQELTDLRRNEFLGVGYKKGGSVEPDKNEDLFSMARRYMGNASEAKNLLKASLFNMYSPFEARDIVEDPNDWRLSDATMRMPGIVDLAVGMPNLPSDLLAIYGMLADNESAIERSERLQVPFAARAQERYMSGLEDAVMRSTGKEIDELSLPMKGILGASEVLSQPGIIPAKALSKLPSIGRGISNALEVFTPVSVASPAALGVGSALGAGLMVLPDLIDSDLEQMDQKYSTAVAEKKRTEGRKQPEKMAAGGLVYDADRVNALAAELTGSEKFSGGGTARLARAARESAKAREQGSEAVSSLANDSGRAADDRFPERIMSVSDAMGVDPRIFQGGSGRQLSGPRLSDIDRLQSLVVETGDRRLPEIPEFRIEDYEGYPIISSMSDRAAAGDFITKINDIPVMVNRRGGQDYMFDPLNEGRVWASDASVVTGQGQTRMQNMAESLRRQYGRDPLLAPWTMAPTGVDYSTMTGETMLQFARNNMTAKTIRQVDKDIKSIIPDWKGIKSEDSIFDFYQASGDQRKSIIQLMDKKYRDAGSLTSGEARLAVTDPGQYMSRDGVLRNIGMIDAAAGATPESAHPTYNMALRGRGLGRLSMPIQAYELFPEAATLGGFDPLNPPRNALRALEMKPYSTLITDDLIRSIQDRRLGN